MRKVSFAQWCSGSSNRGVSLDVLSSCNVQGPEQQPIEHTGERDIPELDIVDEPVSTVGGHVMTFGHVHSSIRKSRP